MNAPICAAPCVRSISVYPTTSPRYVTADTRHERQPPYGGRLLG
ncbi:hypothetical protein M3J09_008566 [Ascochyta lentis]